MVEYSDRRNLVDVGISRYWWGSQTLEGTMEAMTNRELFHATLAGENGGDLLHFEQAFTVPYRTWYREGLPEHVQNAVWCELSEYENLYDHCRVSGWLMSNIEQFCVPGFKGKIVESSEGRDIVIDKNGNKKLQKSNKAYNNEDGSVNGSPPHELSFLISKPEDYERYRHLYIGNTSMRVDMQYLANEGQKYREQNDYISALFVHGPFAFLREMMGTVNAMMLPYEEPEISALILRDHLQTCMEASQEVIRTIHPDCGFVWEDCCGSSGPFVSPSVFDEQFAWWYREWKDYLRTMGVKWIVLDSDGDVSPLVKRWYDAGVDCLNPWEVNAVDMLKIAREYPDFCMMGGIYKHIFEPGSPAQVGKFRSSDVHQAIDDELKRVVEPMRKRGKYIPSLDHAANQATHYHDYRYYCDVLQERYGKANRVTRTYKTW